MVSGVRRMYFLYTTAFGLACRAMEQGDPAVEFRAHAPLPSPVDVFFLCAALHSVWVIYISGSSQGKCEGHRVFFVSNTAGRFDQSCKCLLLTFSPDVWSVALAREQLQNQCSLTGNWLLHKHMNGKWPTV